jgi:HEAT repeat protein
MPMQLLLFLSFLTSSNIWEQLPDIQNAILLANISVLQSNKSEEAKIAALKWLETTKAKDAPKASPVIESLLKGDHPQEVRCNAATCLGLVALRRNLACPHALLVALLDEDEDVAWSAANVAGAFKKFPDKAADPLLKYFSSERKTLRSNVVYMLGRVGKDQKVLDALEQAMSDPRASVRNNAHFALFSATGNFERYLKYTLLVLDDKEGILGKVNESTEEGKHEKEAMDLIMLGVHIRMIRWSESDADKYVTTLLLFLKSDQATLRRAAIFAVKNCFIKVDLDNFLNDHPKHNAKPDNARERQPKAAKLLLDKNILDILQQIEKKDSDPHVRDRAASAIEEIKRLHQP